MRNTRHATQRSAVAMTVLSIQVAIAMVALPLAVAADSSKPSDAGAVAAPQAAPAVWTGELLPVPNDPDYVPSAAVARHLPSPGPVGDRPATSLTPDKGSRNIRVHGRLQYMDSEYVGSFPPNPVKSIYSADCATVHIHDTSHVIDFIVASTVTDADGWFDVTFPIGAILGNPDLHVEFVALNDKVRVEDALFHNSYAWNTGTWNDLVTNDLDVGTFLAAEDGAFPLALMTNFTRAWRWLAGQGYDCPSVVVDADSYYQSTVDFSYHPMPGAAVIECAYGSTSPIDSIWIYGQHFLHSFSTRESEYNYCNPGRWGDAPNGSWCGRSIWGPENERVAWVDGFGFWLTTEVIAGWEEDYNETLLRPGNFESLDVHWPGDPLSDAPNKTIGFATAVLADISDDANDVHPQFCDGVSADCGDALSMGPGTILHCVAADRPVTIQGFLDAFNHRYAATSPELWVTARNTGFQTDLLPPAMVSVVTSSHMPFSTSPDATAGFEWVEPADDASGVAGYAIEVVTTGPATPAPVKAVGKVTEYTTGPLAPGTYWFNIRPVDAAGRWAVTGSSYGPFTIREPDSVNLAFMPREGWCAPLVPTNSNTYTAESCPAPPALYGDGSDTYANVSARNTGAAPVEGGFSTAIVVDGQPAWSWGYALTLDGHAEFSANNLGSFAVRGGRHTFEALLDSYGQVAETDELDNRLAQQWSWLPSTYLVGTGATSNTAPAAATGGWGALPDSVTKYFNCDGFRFDGSWERSRYRVFTAAPSGRNDDVDLRLYDSYLTGTSGFAEHVVESARGPGSLDVIVVDQQVHNPDMDRWDVGVVNTGGATGAYRLASSGGDFSLFTTYSVGGTLDATTMCRVGVCVAQNSPTGRYTLRLETSPPTALVTLARLDMSTGFGTLANTLEAMRTSNGQATIEFTAASNTHIVTVYRDPRSGTTPVTWTLKLVPTPPDLAPEAPDGWHAPLVPRAAMDGTSTSVPAPTAPLPSATAATWWNLAYRNIADMDATAFDAMINVDGVLRAQPPQPALAAGASGWQNSATGTTIQGGRHTASLRLDDYNELGELERSNNVYGEQWVWAPLVLSDGAFIARSATVPNPYGGWQDVTSGEAFYQNCDGLRMRVDPSVSSYQALALLSYSTVYDVDLRLHTVARTATDGFKTPLATSQWSIQKTEFVIANGAVAGGRDYDVGVVGQEGGGEVYYVAESVHATRHQPTSDGRYGSFVFPGNHLLDLREFYLTPGGWDFQLNNVMGAIDWGVSLYPNGVEHLGKSDVLPGAIAYSAAAGQVETFSATIPAAGWYCLAVWKNGLPDATKEGRYSLRVTQRYASGTPENLPAAPSVTTIESVHPNPFNPQATVAFALTAAGPVRLAVYDLHGTKVRTLIDGDLAAGRHEAVWDGRDERGQAVASGVYLARLVAGPVTQMRKMVLMK